MTPQAEGLADLIEVLNHFLERAVPAADKSKLVQKYKVLIAKRFKAQRDWFLTHALTHLKPRFAEARKLREAESDDAIAQSISDLLTGWLDDPETRKQADLLTKLAIQAGIGYIEVTIDAEEFAAALAKLLVKHAGQAYQFGLDNPRAIKYLEEHTFASLARSLDETTASRLKTIIADGLESGGNYNRIASAIRAEFNEMSRSRAVTISTYEMGTAYTQGTLAGAEDLSEAGLDMEKAWLTAQDDAVSEECEENEAADWIPIDEDFPSGDEAPLAHPNCRCALQVRMVRSEELVAAA